MTREETIIPNEDMLTTCGTELKIGTPACIPLTKNERKIIYGICAKRKDTGGILSFSRSYLRSKQNKDHYYYLNPVTNCWEEWSEELEKELLK